MRLVIWQRTKHSACDYNGKAENVAAFFFKLKEVFFSDEISRPGAKHKPFPNFG